MNDTQVPDQGSIAKGILLTLGLHAAAVGVCCGVSLLGNGEVMSGLVPFLGIGIIQLLYIVPALIICSILRQHRTRKGLLIGAGITILINATCAGLVLSSIGH